jgi:hypothetical protein
MDCTAAPHRRRRMASKRFEDYLTFECDRDQDFLKRYRERRVGVLVRVIEGGRGGAKDDLIWVTSSRIGRCRWRR